VEVLISMKNKVTGRLEGWVVQYGVVWGHVYEDIRGRFSDGMWIHTSALLSPREKDLREGVVAITRNSSYLLGKKSKAVV